ncbi:uncharacterized protein METZ01_LOCUS145181, partial [marine metagenome]
KSVTTHVIAHRDYVLGSCNFPS